MGQDCGHDALWLFFGLQGHGQHRSPRSTYHFSGKYRERDTFIMFPFFTEFVGITLLISRASPRQTPPPAASSQVKSSIQLYCLSSAWEIARESFYYSGVEAIIKSQKITPTSGPLQKNHGGLSSNEHWGLSSSYISYNSPRKDILGPSEKLSSPLYRFCLSHAWQAPFLRLAAAPDAKPQPVPFAAKQWWPWGPEADLPAFLDDGAKTANKNLNKWSSYLHDDSWS